MATRRRSLWKLVKGSFSELVCCGRSVVSGRSGLQLDYSAVNLQKRLFTGGEHAKERETAFRRQKSSRRRFLSQKERYYFTRKEKIIFAGEEKRFRALPLRRGTGQK